MMKLFNSYTPQSFPVMIPSDQYWIISSYIREVKKAVRYYTHAVRTVKNTHVLCKLIDILTGNPNMKIDAFMNLVNVRNPYVVRTLGLTSPISYGKVHYGVFRDETSPEILIAKDSVIDIFADYMADDKWMTLQSVKCISHEDSCLSFHILDGRRNTTAEGLSFYVIDVPLLMLQFYCFMKYQLSRRNNPDAFTSIDSGHFVHMYVLPNMIESNMNIAIVNKFMNVHYGKPMDEATTLPPLALIDYNNKIDDMVKDVYNYANDKGLPYESCLRSLPSIDISDESVYTENANAHMALQLPEFPITRQVGWALLVSRLKLIKALRDIGGKPGERINSDLWSQLKIQIRHMKLGLDLKKVLENQYVFGSVHDLYQTYLHEIDDIGIAV